VEVNVFVSCDMEGATGIVHPDQLLNKGYDYARARKFLTGDVAAACAGALAAGATRVVVCDGHGSMRNLLLEDLPAEVEVVVGPASSRTLCQCEGLDETFDAVLLVGYHARNGAPGAVLPHTWIGSLVHEITVNGEVFGETALNAALAGHFGVPVVMVSGDEALVREARELLPEVEAVATKSATGRASAICRTPAWTGPAIRAAAEKALRRRRRPRPFTVKTPVVVSVGFHDVRMADRAMKRPLLERTGPRTVAFSRPDFAAAAAEAWRLLEGTVAEDAEFLR
jgi:D-amino peptidase